MRVPRGLGVPGVAVVAVMLLLAAACGGEEPPAETGNAAAPPAAPAAEQPPEAEAVAGSGEVWADVPAYPGASEVEERDAQQPVSGQMRRYRALQSRIYETDAEVEAVHQFYLDRMPDNGWMRVMATTYDRPPSAMSAWAKEGGVVGANVSVGEDERSGKTYITLMRGEDAG